MTVLITGGAGFLGTLLVKELLQREEQPIVCDLVEPTDRLFTEGIVPYIMGSVVDENFLVEKMRALKVTRVIHLAALLQTGCAQDPRTAIQINVQGIASLLESCRRLGSVKKVVFASSTAVYGAHAGAVDENSPTLAGVSLYGATKLIGEALLNHYRQLYGLVGVSLRFSGIYGPGQVHSPGLAKTIKAIESTILGKDVVIDRVSSTSRHHFVYVKDVVQACLSALFADELAHHVFNVAGGDDSYASFGHFAELIRKMSPIAGRVVFSGPAYDRGRVDTRLARDELAYRPRYTLAQGIEEDIHALQRD